MEGLEFLERYSRQLLLKQFTPENQVKLLRSRVFVAGCGALGSLVSEILARTGIGNIIIADYDFVEISNLHRTSLFDEEDAKLNRPKVLACAEKLQKINNKINIKPIFTKIDNSNVEKMIEGVDLIIDALDNPYDKLLLNEASFKTGIPMIYAGISGFYGTLMIISGKKGPCLECILSDHNNLNQCNMLGTTRITVDIVASIEALLAIRLLLGEELYDQLIYVDAYNLHLEKFKVQQNPLCPTCSLRKFMRIYSTGNSYECRSNIHEFKIDNELVKKISNNIKGFTIISENEFYVFGSVNGIQVILNKSGVLQVRTNDEREAKKIYDLITGS